MGAVPKEKENRRFTYADYKEWELNEGERYSPTAHRFDDGKILTSIFGSDDTVSVSVLPALSINLEQVFAD